jgi:hypothetical protein
MLSRGSQQDLNTSGPGYGTYLYGSPDAAPMIQNR